MLATWFQGPAEDFIRVSCEGYLQTQLWFDVKPDMPGLSGAEVDALYAHGSAWLAGDAG
jgi:hypothetical protein